MTQLRDTFLNRLNQNRQMSSLDPLNESNQPQSVLNDGQINATQQGIGGLREFPATQEALGLNQNPAPVAPNMTPANGQVLPGLNQAALPGANATDITTGQPLNYPSPMPGTKLPLGLGELNNVGSNFDSMGALPQTAMITAASIQANAIPKAAQGGLRGTDVGQVMASNPMTGQFIVGGDLLAKTLGLGNNRNPWEQSRDTVRDYFRTTPLFDESIPDHKLSYTTVGHRTGTIGPHENVVGGGRLSQNPLGGQAIAFFDPIAEVMAGGDEKARASASAILAAASLQNAKTPDDVKNNALSLIEKLGIRYDDIRGGLDQLIADGKIDEERAQVYEQNLESLRG